VLPRALAEVLLRTATLVGMAAATALAVEYRSLESSFCGADSGCAAVRRTGVAYLWNSGITLPELGLLGSALIFALSFWRRSPWAAWLAIAAAPVALGLLGYQLALGTFCWLCVTADLAALVAGVAGLLLLRASKSDTGSGAPALSPLRWSVLGVLAVLGPALWPSVKPVSPIPASVRAHYVDGKINVVEFADFECPYCRLLHGPLKGLLQAHGERVHFVRLNVPLPSHPNAKDAARAAICAEPSGQGESYADFLFTTEDLSREALIAEAARRGMERAAFERCLAAPETDRRIEREIAVLREAGMQGLPTTYIGSHRFVGAVSEEVLKDAIDRAARGSSERGVPGWIYLVLIAGIAAVVVVRRGQAEPELHARPR